MLAHYSVKARLIPLLTYTPALFAVDQCPDKLTLNQLKDYFTALIKSHSWSTVKIDRNGLQFFYKHVLNKDWQWVKIVKPPQKKVLPNVLTLK